MNKATILAVDDQKTNRVVIQTRLQDEYNVVLASSGNEALSALEQNTIDLILLDIVLDGQDGIEICRLIKNNPKTTHIPVIFLTGMSNQDKIEECFQAGASDYVNKNFNTGELKLRIKNQFKLIELGQLLRTGIANMQKTIPTSEEFKLEMINIANKLEQTTMLINKYCHRIKEMCEKC